jgi:hypothetical protein
LTSAVRTAPPLNAQLEFMKALLAQGCEWGDQTYYSYETALSCGDDEPSFAHSDGCVPFADAAASVVGWRAAILQALHALSLWEDNCQVDRWTGLAQ